MTWFRAEACGGKISFWTKLKLKTFSDVDWSWVRISSLAKWVFAEMNVTMITENQNFYTILKSVTRWLDYLFNFRPLAKNAKLGQVTGIENSAKLQIM